MPRLFVALDLPDEAKDRLLEVRPVAIPAARLVNREEFHLTLHFIGEVDDNQAIVIREALQQVRCSPFVIDLDGVGRFPADGNARVLWAGVRPNQHVSDLHRALAETLTAAIGFRPEDRPYRPHVTLAYFEVDPTPDAVEQYLQDHASFHVPDVPISRFSLYSSLPIATMSRYQAIATYDL